MKIDSVALVIGLACLAVASAALLQHVGHQSTLHLGVIAPLTLIVIGVVGLLASRRNHKP